MISVSSSVPEEEVLSELNDLGVQTLFSTFEQKEQSLNIAILFHGNTNDLLIKLPYIKDIQKCAYEGIDWNQQWQLHCKEYSNGQAVINLQDYTQILEPVRVILEPGPGFGDLSHTTTQLILKLMANSCKNQHVLDIGCGSGILSLAALALGACFVVGIDIDATAIAHAKQNLSLNRFSGDSIFGTLAQLKSTIQSTTHPLVLMNMIRSEQQCAWNDVSPFLTDKFEIITSGIHKSERDAYLKMTASWNWNLLEEIEEKEWLGFRACSKSSL